MVNARASFTVRVGAGAKARAGLVLGLVKV